MRKIGVLTWTDVDLNDLSAKSFIKSKGGIKDESENLTLDNWKNYGQVTDKKLMRKMS